MENDNETVEQVYEEMKEVTGTRRFIDSHYCNHCGDQIDGEGSALDVYADRILAAHKLEVAELRECLKEAIREKCPFTRMSCKHGEPCEYVCGTDKWRKVLEGANDEGK